MEEESNFKTDYPHKCFMELNAKFWDSDERISKLHQSKCKYLMEELSTEDEEKKKKIEKTILSTTESLKVLVERDLKHYYLIFLKYSFCLSQPLTLRQLKDNFKNKIFPYYIFTLLSKKKEIIFLIIDFLDKTIKVLNKDKIVEIIKQDEITSVSKKNNTSINITFNDKEEIEIFPEFFQQVELIYILIDFFGKIAKSSKKEDGELSLLEDDTYTPKGILLKNHILKEHQNILLSKDKRYAVLGPSQIIIFKDKTMIEIRNVIPLLPFSSQLISDDKEMIITLKYLNRNQSLTFFKQEAYISWKNILKDIFNKKNMEKIEGITYYLIKEKQLNIKIIDLLNDEIKEAQENKNKLNEELENVKQLIIKDKNI
jgi:hypothetical protein